jgi:hypothetical protein
MPLAAMTSARRSPSISTILGLGRVHVGARGHQQLKLAGDLVRRERAPQEHDLRRAREVLRHPRDELFRDDDDLAFAVFSGCHDSPFEHPCPMAWWVPASTSLNQYSERLGVFRRSGRTIFPSRHASR